MKLHGKPNDLMERIAGDGAFARVKDELNNLMEPARYIGLAAEQTREYLAEHVQPVLQSHRDWLGRKGQVSV